MDSLSGAKTPLGFDLPPKPYADADMKVELMWRRCRAALAEMVKYWDQIPATTPAEASLEKGLPKP